MSEEKKVTIVNTNAKFFGKTKSGVTFYKRAKEEEVTDGQSDKLPPKEE